jgi:hypothetical protein
MTGPPGLFSSEGSLVGGVEERPARRGAAARGTRVTAAGVDAHARRPALRGLAVVRARLRRTLCRALRRRATTGDEPGLAASGPRRTPRDGALAALVHQRRVHLVRHRSWRQRETAPGTRPPIMRCAVTEGRRAGRRVGQMAGRHEGEKPSLSALSALENRWWSHCSRCCCSGLRERLMLRAPFSVRSRTVW